MKTVLRIALAALAIVGFAVVETLAQKMLVWRTSIFRGGRWRAMSAADASEVLTYAFGKRGNNLGSTWGSQLRLGVPAPLRP